MRVSGRDDKKMKCPVCKKSMIQGGDVINVQVYFCENENCEGFSFSKYYTLEAKKYGKGE